MTKYTIDYIDDLIKSRIGNRDALNTILESIRSGNSLTSYQVDYLEILEKSRYHLTELAKSIQTAKKCIPKKELLPPSMDILSASELIKQNKFEITTLTSLPKLDPVKQSKYDQMLSQLSSDVIPPAPMKPKITEKPREVIPEIKEQEVIPVVEEKPQPVVEQITKPTINEMPSPVVELPEESDIDDEDDDIEQIKSKILKTLSKIEQAEVD